MVNSMFIHNKGSLFIDVDRASPNLLTSQAYLRASAYRKPGEGSSGKGVAFFLSIECLTLLGSLAKLGFLQSFLLICLLRSLSLAGF
jgi:hypothetical protein